MKISKRYTPVHSNSKIMKCIVDPETGETKMVPATKEDVRGEVEHKMLFSAVPANYPGKKKKKKKREVKNSGISKSM